MDPIEDGGIVYRLPNENFVFVVFVIVVVVVFIAVSVSIEIGVFIDIYAKDASKAAVDASQSQ